MAKFRIYNIQLLPDEEGVDEVGVSGYRKLFSELRDLNNTHLRDKTQALFHYGLPGDTYISPHDFRFPAGSIYGNFCRYTRTDELKELRTGKTIFKAGKKTAVASKKMIPFVFDTKRHFLAIDGANLPKGSAFIDALQKFFEPIVATSFPNHTLTINLISRVNALEDVFDKAVAYKTVDVSLAFPNGHDTEQLLRELKESKTQLTIHASGGIKGRMTSVPDFLKGLLRAAVLLGSAKISYFIAPEPGKEVTRRETYNSEDTPVTFVVRRSASDLNERQYFERVAEKLESIDTSAADEDENPQTGENNVNL